MLFRSGQIFWQEFEAGSLFHRGGTMKVKVSLGTAYAIIPDYSSCTVSEYETYLQNAKIKNYQLVEENSYGSPNTVLRLEINGNTVYSGDKVDNSKDEKLIVYYQSEVVTTAPVFTEPEETTITETVAETEEVTETVPVETETSAIIPEETQPEETIPEETNPPPEEDSENSDEGDTAE